MATEKPRYNYHPLDQFLTDYLDPQALGNQLDEIMHDLASHQGNPSEGRYDILRTLRDLFWKLQQS